MPTSIFESRAMRRELIKDEKQKSSRMLRKAERQSVARYRAKSRRALLIDDTMHDRSQGNKESRDKSTTRNKLTRTQLDAKTDNIYQQAPKEEGSPSIKYSKKNTSDERVIRDALRKNYVFSDLSYIQLKPLVSAFEKVVVDALETIIVQGDEGDYFYIVEDGEVQFEVNNVIVGKAGKGDSFGELALIYSSPRAATVRTLKRSSIFRVDQTTFRRIMITQAEASEAHKIRRIQNVDFLKDLSKDDIKKLGSVMTPRMFEKGEVLQKEGSPTCFYLIEEGTVTSVDGELGPGEYFGKGSLVASGKNDPVITASKAGMAFTISGEKFKNTIGDVIMLVTKAKDSETLAKVQCLGPAKLNPRQLDSLARLIKDKEYPKGKRFMKEGSPLVNVLYILREGKLLITEGKQSFEVGPGAVIGLEPVQKHDGHCVRPNIKSAAYGAKCVDKCVIGLLSIKKCRKVFDTTVLGDIQEEIIEEEEEEEAISPSRKRFSRPEQSLPTVAKAVNNKARIKSFTEELRLKIRATNVPLEKLKKHSILGEGSFGQVWLVSEEIGNNTQQTYALKIQSKFDLISGGQAETIMKEKEIMKTLQHPFILQLVKTYEDSNFVYMLLELVQGGELFSIISTDENPILPESSSKFYALGIAEALSFMHSKHIASRDLKPENVLIDREGYPIVIDFGFATHITGKSFTLCGTPNFLAPEMISGRGHDYAVDHWALGIVVYEMITGGEHPFYMEGLDQATVFRSILKDPFPKPAGVSPEAADFVSKLLVKDPSQRLGSLSGGELDVLEHPWFDGIDHGMLRRRKLPAPWIPPIKGDFDVGCFDDWSDLQDRTTESYPELTEAQQKEFEGFT